MRKGMRGLVVGLVAALLVSIVAPAASAQTTDENYLFDLINTKRDAKGKQVLTEHASILREARAHSIDMADRGAIGHAGFDQRVNAIRADDGGIDGYICENVAYASGQGSAEAALRVIFKGWRRSKEGHRECLFDLGNRTQSAALGLEKRGNTWWATFITAKDSSP